MDRAGFLEAPTDRAFVVENLAPFKLWAALIGPGAWAERPHLTGFELPGAPAAGWRRLGGCCTEGQGPRFHALRLKFGMWLQLKATNGNRHQPKILIFLPK